MKKSTGSILLLSAFAALVLAGCGKDTKDSSATTGSSDTAVQTSADETSPAGTSEAGTSATGTSAAGTSTASSSATASSSSAASSSSTPAVETDWSNKTFIGEYLGGMNNLIINADKTTSWGTSTDKFPATYTELSTGVWMIKSAATVADEDYVEVITDGTMAYVMHDKEAYDYYVMDKNALGSAVIAFCETEDQTKFFGGIEITANHWKYFACINGTYTFGATITVQAGTNINAGGAIFDFGAGTSKTSWKVTSPAVAATSFATIEQTNFTATTYTGDHGDLVIGTDDEGLVFAKLNGVALPGATLSQGGVLSVPKENSPATYDMTNSAGPSKIVSTTTYTLATIALTYTQGEGTMVLPLFDEVSGQTGTYQGEADDGGHLWVWFTATASGKLTVTQDGLTSYTDSTGSYDFMTIYDTSDTSIDDYDSAYTGMAYDNSYSGNICQIQNVEIEVGHTYVIRAGAYPDNSKDWRATGSAYAGETLSINWTFAPYTLETYSGDAGDLVIEKDGTTIIAIRLNGQKMGSYTLSGNNLSTSVGTLDMTNPADPAYTVVTSTLTLDPATGTYTGTSTPVTTHPFHALAETDTSYSAQTGSDGNIWITFTPSSDGRITVTETTSEVDDSYLQVFEYDPSTGVDGLTSSGKKRLDYEDYGTPLKSTVNVKAGVTYVIKLGDFGAKDKLVGDTADAADVGKTEGISFEFVDYVARTFTGAEGDLVITTQRGNYMSSTLNGTDVTGSIICDIANGVYTVVGAQTLDTSDPDNYVYTSTDDVYTLDLVNNTYTKNTVANSRPAMQKLTEASTSCTGLVSPDGSMWASFTPSENGLLSLQETIQCSNGTAHDSLVAVYEEDATTYTAYSTNGLIGVDNGTDLVSFKDLFVQAGKTYIIKIGVYWANSVDFCGTNLSSSYTGYVGSPEGFTLSFEVLPTTTYTNASGDPLTVITRNGNIYKTLLGEDEINATLNENGKSLSVPGTLGPVDSTNRLDPVASSVSTVYYLDNEELTYEVGTETQTIHLFHTLQPTDTSFTGVVGNDGNLWGIFTAPEDGAITVEETETTSHDGYIQIFESTATAFTYANCAAYNDDSSTATHWGGKITNFSVQAGHTYVIKGGAAADKDKVIGGSGTSTYAGSTETISFTFRGADHDVYTGPEGELHKLTLNGTYIGATLDGEAFNGTPNATKTVYTTKESALDTGTFDVTTTEKTYTLGEGTYEVSSESETQNILSDTWDSANSGDYTAAGNGSVLIKFTAPTSGTYTFKALASTDCEIGLYADNLDEKGFVGAALTEKDGASANREESFTYTCEAGVTYYFRASAHYSEWTKSITDMGSTRAGTTITMTIA